MATSPTLTPFGQVGEPVTGRSAQFKKLSQRLPGLIGQQGQQAQNANMANLQQAVQKTVGSGAAPTTGQVQQLAGQATAQKGQTALATAQQGVQQQGQVAQLGAEEQNQARKNSLAQRGLELERENARLLNELDSLNSSLKSEIFDKQEQFQKDELGRTVFNDRQLADYALTAAKSDEDLRNFEQQVQYYSSLRQNVLKAAHQRIVQSMDQANKFAEFDKDSKLKIRLAQAKAAIEEKMRKEAAKQKNRAGMFQAAGSIVAMGALTVATGGAAAPLAIMAAGSAGGAAGSIVASQTK